MHTIHEIEIEEAWETYDQSKVAQIIPSKAMDNFNY